MIDLILQLGMSFQARLLNLILLVACLACDRVVQDMRPGEEEIVLSDNELTALPNAPLLVNLKALTDSKVTTTFRLDRLPKSGEVSFTAKGTLIYTPNASFVAGDDLFSIASDASATDKETPPLMFAITMVPDAEQLPCDVGGTTDIAETNANTPITINVLRTGTFCDHKPDPASLQIETAPQSGSVRVVSGQIVYTPTRNFTGRDLFVYRVCPQGSTESGCVLSAATVLVNEVVSNCRIRLQNDQALFRQRFITDSLVIPVLANDRLCKANRLLPLQLTVKPTGGSAYLTAKNTIVYKPQLSTTSDKIQYQRCENGECVEANVSIMMSQPDAGCALKANNNTVQLVLSQPTAAMRRGIVPINVLSNDVLCSPLRSVMIKNNPTNARLQVLSTGHIAYTMDSNPTAKVFSFTYELTDAQGRVSVATVKVNIKS